MTKREAEAARARCEAATRGPWQAFGFIVQQPLLNMEYPEGSVRWVQSLTFEHKERAEPDGKFIAAARTDLPAALNMLEKAMCFIARADVTCLNPVRRGQACNLCWACVARELMKEWEGQS